MKKTLLVSVLIFFNLIGYCQQDFYCSRNYEKQDSMSRAWYPYQIVDSIRFPDYYNFLIADSDIKPDNFISWEERLYKSKASLFLDLSKTVCSQIL